MTVLLSRTPYLPATPVFSQVSQLESQIYKHTAHNRSLYLGPKGKPLKKQ